MKSSSKRMLPATLIIASFVLVPWLQAAVISKADNADNLNLDSSWGLLSVPTATDIAQWDAAVTAPNTVLLGANLSFRGLSVTNPLGDVTISAGSILTLGRSGIDLSTATANLGINAGVTLASGHQQWVVSPTQTLTLAAVPVRNAGGTNADVGGTVNIANTGIVKIGAAALASITDGGGNPFIAFNTDDWAATDATGLVTPVAYTIGSSGALAANVHNDIQGDMTMGASTPSSIRFSNTGAPVTLNPSGAVTATSTLRGILMTSGSLGATMGGQNIRPNRTSTAGASFSIIQNSTLGDLTINSTLPSASSNTPVSIVKSGVGKVILAGNIAMNGLNVAGQIFINEGTLQIGVGTATGVLSNAPNTGAPIPIINRGRLIINKSDNVTWPNVISGTGSVTKQGAGSLTLSGANTFSGPTILEGGVFNFTGPSNFGTGNNVVFNGGTLLQAPGNTTDISGSKTVSMVGEGTLDTNGQDITWVNSVGDNGPGGFVKAGAGTLTLMGANTYLGNTTVSGGRVIVMGSLAGGASVNNAASLGGDGSLAGLLSVNSGGALSPGNAGVGTLNVGGLMLNAGSVVNTEFGAGNDQVNVTLSGGLTINGGGYNLYQAGGNTAFSTNGTYDLMSYTGAVGGAGTSGLSVLNPQPGKNYTFAATGSKVTVTIAVAGVLSDWNVDADGMWGTSANWANNTVPNGAGHAANLNFPLTAPHTITLDAARTLAGLSISGAVPYTVAPGTGGSVVLDNGASQANLVVTSGQHSISAPVSLNSTTVAAISDNASLSLSDTVSGAGVLAKSGLGILDLAGNNSYIGGTNINEGTVSFTTATGLGTGSLILNGGTLKYNAGNTADISTLPLVSLDVNGGTIDTNGNNVTYSLGIGGGGSGGLTKAGGESLTLNGGNSYTGPTIARQGELNLYGANASSGLTLAGNAVVVRINSEAAVGPATSNVTFNPGIGEEATLTTTGPVTLAATQNVFLTSGTATIDTMEQTVTLASPLVGPADLTKLGSGILALTAINNTSATGKTVVQAGVLQAGSANLPSGSVTLNGTAILRQGATSLGQELIVNGTNELHSGDNGGASAIAKVTGAGHLAVYIAGANVDLRGDLTAYTGTIQVASATGTLRLNGTTGSSSATFDLGSAGSFTVRNGAAAIALGALNGGASAIVNGSTSSATNLIYSIGGAGTNSTFSGTIINGSFAGSTTGINKVGPGSFTSEGANTYTGPTTVTAGTLMLNGNNTAATGAISVNAGGTLGGSGQLGGVATVANGGTLSPGVGGVGTLTTNTVSLEGILAVDIDGALPQQADILSVQGDLTLGSNAGVSFGTPVNAPTGTAIVLASYTGTLTGTFASTANLPAGWMLDYAYNDGVSTKNIALVVGTASPFSQWAAAAGLTGNDALPTADPDKDGSTNLLEFALNSSPTNAAASGKMRVAIDEVAATKVLTITIPVRTNTVFAATPSQVGSKDGLVYTIAGSDDLTTWTTQAVEPVTPAISAGLPALDNGWSYYTFQIPDGVDTQNRAYLRVAVTAGN